MKTLYYLTFSAIVLICLGNSVGAGLVQNRDFTGSPLSNSTCNACHSGGNFNPQPVIELLDQGVAVDQYVPGQTYDLKMTVNVDNFPGAFGFQMVGLNDANETGGSFGDSPSGTRLITINGRRYFEHTMPIMNNEFTIEWTAPEVGSGDVSFYGVANAVNRTGGTGGDVAGTGFVKVTEGVGASSYDRNQEFPQIKIYPTPTFEVANIDLPDNVNPQNLSVKLFDLSGRLVNQFQGSSFDVSSLNSGAYLLHLEWNGNRVVRKLIKN